MTADKRPPDGSCLYCGEGTYRDMRISDSTDLHNSGLGLRLIGMTRWAAVECDKCGNVQVFRKRGGE